MKFLMRKNENYMHVHHTFCVMSFSCIIKLISYMKHWLLLNYGSADPPAPPPLKSGHLGIKDAQCAKNNDGRKISCHIILRLAIWCADDLQAPKPQSNKKYRGDNNVVSMSTNFKYTSNQLFMPLSQAKNNFFWVCIGRVPNKNIWKLGLIRFQNH